MKILLALILLSRAKLAITADGTTPTGAGAGTGAGTAPMNSACGAWIPYKAESCIIVLEVTQTKENADNACKSQTKGEIAEQSGKLITVKTIEKQKFIHKMLFEDVETFDNVWLGMELGPDDALKWNDGSKIVYHNWAPHITATTDHQCAEIVTGDYQSIHKTGDWARANCKKRNLVLCEKKQPISMSVMQSSIQDLKDQGEKNQQEIEKKINSSKEATEKLIATNKQEADNKLEALSLKTDEKIKALKQEVDRINTANKNDTDSKLTALEGQLTAVKQELEHKMKTVIVNSVPIGFTYIQLHGQESPEMIWPNAKWRDVSETYAGLFFRAVGGNAATFGEIQEENSPRFANVEWQQWGNRGGFTPKIQPIPADGAWSDWIFSGDWEGDHDMFMRFQLLPGELRPRNQAIRIWIRWA